MSKLGVKVSDPMKRPPRSYAIVASTVWLVVSLPFFYLSYLYWNGPVEFFTHWRGWVFAAVAVACVLMATVVPPRYRLAILGTKLRGWGSLL